MFESTQVRPSSDKDEALESRSQAQVEYMAPLHHGAVGRVTLEVMAPGQQGLQVYTPAGAGQRESREGAVAPDELGGVTVSATSALRFLRQRLARPR